MSKTKIFAALLAVCAVCLAICYLIHNNGGNDNTPDEPVVVENVSVDSLISTDMAYMDSLHQKYVFFESRVILQKPFNESDYFAADEVTNVFQTYVQEGKGTKTTVYFFTHELNDCGPLVEIHENAFITDDIAINMDSITIGFEHAFLLARESNFAPSKSKYMTLRHGFGPKPCNPFYTIGNNTYGHLWVDALTGKVTDTDPARN